jgi:HD superfamily phosphohydrolase YqeK
MSLLEKIIFTADYIEPYRKPLPRIDDIRRAAYSELDLGVFMILENMLYYLNDTAAVIDPLTVDTYQYYEAVLQTQD